MIEHLLALLPEGMRGANLLLLAGTLLVALLAARRAQIHQINPAPVANQLLLGLLIGLPLAAGALLARPGAVALSAGLRHLALAGGLLVLTLGLLLAIRLRRLPLLRWLDVAVAPLLLGLAIGRLAGLLGTGGAAGAPLFELLWDIGAVSMLHWLERRRAGRLLPGDSALLCGLLASAGRVLLGVSLGGPCGAPLAAGACGGGLHPAQLLSIVALFGCAAILAWRHSQRAAAYAPERAGPSA